MGALSLAKSVVGNVRAINHPCLLMSRRTIRKKEIREKKRYLANRIQFLCFYAEKRELKKIKKDDKINSQKE